MLKRLVWTDELDLAFQRAYAKGGAVGAAKALNIEFGQARSRAANMGYRLAEGVSPAHVRHGGPSRAEVVRAFALTKRGGITSADIAELCGISSARGASAALDATERGLLFKSADGKIGRWFAEASWIVEWKTAQDERKRADRAAKHARSGNVTFSAKQAGTARLKTTADRAALPAVIPPGLVIQRAPKPPERFAVDLDSMPRLFSAVPVGVDATTGRAWA